MNQAQLLSELKLKELDTRINSNYVNSYRCICFCNFVCYWFINLLLWTSIITAIIFQQIFLYILAGLFYLKYLFRELFSPNLKILCSISNQTINEIIGKFIKGKPVILLKCHCFHYEERAAGRGSTRTVEVISHSETLNYNYNFCRDISGLLILNTDESNIKLKYYIGLKIIKKVYMSDENSISHYASLKNIIENNRDRDKYFRAFNVIDIEGLPDYFLIKLKDDHPWFIGNGFWYIFFTLITLVEFYKIYVKLLIFDQTIIIKKVISISDDVNTDARFDTFKPLLFIKHTNQYFDYNELNLTGINLLNEQTNEINKGSINTIKTFNDENRNNQQNIIN